MTKLKLWVQLTLSSATLVVTTVLCIGLIANQQVGYHFRHFVAGLPQSYMVEQLTSYYASHQSWQGVGQVFASASGSGSPPWAGSGMGQGQGMGPRWSTTSETEETGGGMGGGGMGGGYGRNSTFILADASGTVVYDGSGSYTGDTLTKGDSDRASPLIVQDETVGYLLVHMPAGMSLPPGAQSFLMTLNETLVQAGLIAGCLGLVLGLAMARRLSAPLLQLETVARQISQGDLEQRVPLTGPEEIASVAHAFNDMAESLQQARQLQHHMVADIAHELRTPLSVLQGNLQAILDDVYPLDKAEIAAIYDETLILNRLISDLRELNRAETGQLSLSIEPFDIAPLIRQSVALFEGLANEKEMALTVALPETLPLVMADPARVRQIVHNLLSNALRHTPNHGTIAVAATTESAVRPMTGERQERPGAWLQISVSDTGSGMPAESLPHVFDRFWRADCSRSRDQGGSGLGLAIARQLVEAQGGYIGVESEPDTGSRFWFVLPVQVL